MQAARGMAVAAVATLAVSLSGCVFAIGNTPDDEGKVAKRLKALEMRVGALEKKCQECGECEVEGLDEKTIKGLMQGAKGKFRTIVIKGDMNGNGVFESAEEDDEKDEKDEKPEKAEKTEKAK